MHVLWIATLERTRGVWAKKMCGYKHTPPTTQSLRCPQSQSCPAAARHASRHASHPSARRHPTSRSGAKHPRLQQSRWDCPQIWPSRWLSCPGKVASSIAWQRRRWVRPRNRQSACQEVVSTHPSAAASRPSVHPSVHPSAAASHPCAVAAVRMLTHSMYTKKPSSSSMR